MSDQSNTITNYKIITFDTNLCGSVEKALDLLRDSVTFCLNEGWVCQGGIAFVQHNGNITVAQSMTQTVQPWWTS